MFYSIRKKIRITVIVILAGLMTGCNDVKREPTKLNIVLFGYDSIATYYGSSVEMLDLQYGKLTDSLFLDSLIKTATVRKPGLIALKPAGGAGVLGNWEFMDTMLMNRTFEYRVIDTFDEKEQQFFKTTSAIPPLMELQKEPLKLFLPKGTDVSQTPDTSANRLVVLMLNDNEVYAYDGPNARNGRKSTYELLRSYLSTKKKKPDFSVVIKPAKTSSYKSLVDVLDLMSDQKIKSYSLQELTAEEEALIEEVLR